MAHIAKYQAAALGGMLAHYARTPELERGYRRDNIDPARTRLNYNLAPAHPCGQVGFIHDRIASLGLRRRVRKDAIRMCDCVLTAPPEVQDVELRKFFEAESAALGKAFGADNCISAWVHMDEPGARPHMHWAWVPVTPDGRLSAKDVVSRAALRALHPALQKAADAALGHHVQVQLDDGRRAAAYVGLAEYKRATEEASRAAERAAGADKAAQAAERAQKAAEDRKRASEAAAEASERARAQASDAAKSAKEDMQRQRDFAKRLGNQGKGIDWQYPDGHVEHESSVGEVRAERDAAKAEADAAMQKRDGLLAFAAEIRGERYEIDGRTYKGISAMADELKGLRADCAAAKNELSAAQDKAAAARRAAAEAETAKAQAEASLSKIQDSVRQSQEDARAWRDKADLQQRRMGVRPMHLASALREMCRQMADVCLDLWTYARDAARRAWDRWAGEGLGKCADAFGVSYMDALDVAYGELEDRAYAHGMGRAVVDDLTRGPGELEQDQEREDDWER